MHHPRTNTKKWKLGQIRILSMSRVKPQALSSEATLSLICSSGTSRREEEVVGACQGRQEILSPPWGKTGAELGAKTLDEGDYLSEQESHYSRANLC